MKPMLDDIMKAFEYARANWDIRGMSESLLMAHELIYEPENQGTAARRSFLENFLNVFFLGHAFAKMRGNVEIALQYLC